MINSSARAGMERPRVFAAVAVVSCALAVAGCGSRGMTTIRGVVTLDGKPIEKAIVQFIPEKGDAKTAVALTDRDGRYAVAVDPVPFRVTIVAQQIVGQKKDDANPNGSLIDIYEDVIPPHSTKVVGPPFQVEAVAGTETTADFRMTSKPGR